MSLLSYTKDFNNNFMMLLLRDHRRYRPIVEFFDNVTLELAELTWSECELIAAELSKDNRSEFCMGIRGGVIATLNADARSLKSDKLAPVLTFALKVNRAPSEITASDVQSLLDAGWSEQTIEDVVGLVAIQRLYSTLATSLGFKGLPQAAFVEIGEDTVAKKSYLASFMSFVETTGQAGTPRRS